MVSAIMQGVTREPRLAYGSGPTASKSLLMFAPSLCGWFPGTQDWTRNVPHEEYPAIKKSLRALWQSRKVDVVQIDSPHRLQSSSREAVYSVRAKGEPRFSSERADLESTDIRVELLEGRDGTIQSDSPPDATDGDGVLRQWQQMGQSGLAKLNTTRAANCSHEL